MNIFYLSNDVQKCAEMHVDKHCVKMILEYAQLLSTAHRVLDGTLSIGVSKTGRKQTRYVLPDNRESILYASTHINHPSAIWCRKGIVQYRWLHNLLIELCKEYTYRYDKIELEFTLYVSGIAGVGSDQHTSVCISFGGFSNFQSRPLRSTL